MANFCLLPEKVNEFKKALKDKDIVLADLINLDHADLTAKLEPYAGANAPQIATLIEEKLILKNRMIGLTNVLSKLTETGKYSVAEKARLAKIKSDYRAAQMERVFSPKENQSYLGGVADEIIGTEITKEEAKNIFELSARADELRKGFDGEKWTNEKDRLTYGASKVLYENYVAELKGENTPIKEQIKGRIAEFKKTAGENPSLAVLDLGKDTLKTISNNAISFVASVDNSMLGRQGLKTLITHPTKWLPAAGKSFTDIAKTLGGQETMDALMADIYSRPNYLNGEYVKSGILTATEEQFPTSLPERIPYLGRVFKASEVAFKGSAIRMRTDLYDLLAKNAREQGIKMTDIQIKDIGTGINSVTARGKGKLTENELVKLVLWSPRMLKANYDTLTAHSLGAGLKTPFARKEAFKNWAKIVGVLGTLLLIAKANGNTDLDTTSSDFGNIVVADTKVSRIMGVMADFVGISSNTYNGKTRFNVTGGMNSLITFVSRFAQGKRKNATTGVTTYAGEGFGASDRFDYFIDFLTGKTQPLVKVGIDTAKQRDFEGNKPTVGSTLKNVTVPLSVKNILDINKNKDGTDGIDWNQNTGKELQAFKDKIGKDKFKEANDKYNQKYNEWLANVVKKGDFKALSEEDKQKVINNKKTEIKNSVFKEYGFKYKQPVTQKLPKF